MQACISRSVLSYKAGKDDVVALAGSMICCISVLLVKVYVGAIMVLGLLIILMFWIWGVAA